MKKRDALKTYVNTAADASALSSRLQSDLNIVATAYESAATSLIELEKAFARIDSIASQEGSGAAVKAFREIAAAQKDIASTLIALRAEGRTTIRASLADAQADAATPLSPASAGDAMVYTPSEKISPSHASPEESQESSASANSNSAPAANNSIPTINSNEENRRPPAGGRPLPLVEFLNATVKK